MIVKKKTTMGVSRRSDGEVVLSTYEDGLFVSALTMNTAMAEWLHRELTIALGGEAKTRSRGRCAPGLPEALEAMRKNYPATFRAHGLSPLLRQSNGEENGR